MGTNMDLEEDETVKEREVVAERSERNITENHLQQQVNQREVATVTTKIALDAGSNATIRETDIRRDFIRLLEQLKDSIGAKMSIVEAQWETALANLRNHQEAELTLLKHHFEIQLAGSVQQASQRLENQSREFHRTETSLSQSIDGIKEQLKQMHERIVSIEVLAEASGSLTRQQENHIVEMVVNQLTSTTLPDQFKAFENKLETIVGKKLGDVLPLHLKSSEEAVYTKLSENLSNTITSITGPLT